MTLLPVLHSSYSSLIFLFLLLLLTFQSLPKYTIVKLEISCSIPGVYQVKFFLHPFYSDSINNFVSMQDLFETLYPENERRRSAEVVSEKRIKKKGREEEREDEEGDNFYSK